MPAFTFDIVPVVTQIAALELAMSSVNTAYDFTENNANPLNIPDASLPAAVHIPLGPQVLDRSVVSKYVQNQNQEFPHVWVVKSWILFTKYTSENYPDGMLAAMNAYNEVTNTFFDNAQDNTNRFSIIHAASQIPADPDSPNSAVGYKCDWEQDSNYSPFDLRPWPIVGSREVEQHSVRYYSLGYTHYIYYGIDPGAA